MATQTKIDPAELGAIARAIYGEKIQQHVAASDKEKFVLIDVDSGAYEIGADDLALEERLLARYPNANMVLLGADGGTTDQFGWTSFVS